MHIFAGNGGEVVIDIEFLPFADLTEFPGVKELDKTGPDPTSEAVYIPDGLIFGDKIVTSAYVSPRAVTVEIMGTIKYDCHLL